MVFALDDRAFLLWLRHGARNLDQLFKPQWRECLTAPDLLVSAMPELMMVLRTEVLQTARCQAVTELSLCFEDALTPFACLMWEKTLYLAPQQLAEQPRAERLRLELEQALREAQQRARVGLRAQRREGEQAGGTGGAAQGGGAC